LVHWRQDALGHSAELHYLRTKDGTEVDFCIGDHHAEAATPEVMIEVKASDAKPHSALRAFSERWPSSEPIQLVSDLSVEQDVRGIKIRRASDWLAQLDA
jgi:predicted AAA+ superfamily ATPase